jgi:TP901 family phage tail tape measure protein
MAQELELLLKAKNLTDEAFRAVEQHLKSLEKASKKNEAGFARAARRLDDFGKSMTSVGRGLLPISAALGGLGLGVFKLASDFESSFAGVRKTVDATEAEFAALALGFREMSKEIPVSVNELNRIGEAAGQLGIETENILGFTRVMADLGATTNLSAEEAATALARLANITQLPQDQFDEMGSTIVALGNNFATTEAEIVDFGLRIAGAAKLAGIAEADILAIGTAMSSIGVQSEAGGTAVQKVLNQMTAAVATNSEELQTFARTAGLSAEAFAEAFEKDAAGAFTSFVEGLGRQGTEAFTTLQNLGLENQRVIRAFLGLAGAGDLLSETLKTGSEAWRENTALSKEAEQRYATFESQLKTFWNQLKDIGITLGTALLPTLIDVLGVMKEWLPVVEGAAGAFADLPGPVRAVALAAAALAAAAGPVLIALGFMSSGVAALVPLFTAAAPAVAGLTAAFLPLTAAVAALVGGAKLGLWLRENTKWFETLTNFIGDAFSELSGLAFYNKLQEEGIEVTEQWSEAQNASLAAHIARQAALQREAILHGNLNEKLDEAAGDVRNLADAIEISTRATNAEIVAAVRASEATDALKAASKLLGREIKDIAEAERILEIAAANTTEALEEQRRESENLSREMSNLVSHLREVGNTVGLVFDELGSGPIAGVAGSIRDADQAAFELGFSLAEAALEGGRSIESLRESLEGMGLSARDVESIIRLLGPSLKDAGDEGGVSFSDGFAASVAKLPDVIIGALQGGGDVFRAVGASIGADMGEELGKTLTTAIGGTLGKTLGSLAGPLGALAGSALGGIFDSLFGADPEEEVNDLRDAFFDLNGGFVAVQQSLVGLTDQDLVKKVFDARTVDEFNAAVAEVNTLLGLQGQAQADLQAAVEKYGFSIEELGPKFQQQELDKMVGSLLKDYELLVASGIDVNTVIEKMGPNFQEYVDTAIAAGASLPENMRPIIEAMVRQGALLDENGDAFESVEETGLSFTESLTDGLSRVIDSIEKLVAALTGIPPVNIPVNYQDPGPPPGHPGPGPEFARGGVVLPFRPRAAAEGLVVPSSPGGELVRMGEAGQAELAAPVKALLSKMQETALLAAGGGEQRIILQVDGQALSEVVVRRNRAGLLPIRESSVRRY